MAMKVKRQVQIKSWRRNARRRRDDNNMAKISVKQDAGRCQDAGGGKDKYRGPDF